MLPTDLLLIFPEIIVVIAASMILLIGTFFKRGALTLSLIILVMVAISSWFMTPSLPTAVLENSLLIDRFGATLKIVLCLLLGLIFIYSRVYMQVRRFMHGEFFALTLLSMLGMMIIISSNNFLSMFLGLELLVLPLYALIVLANDNARYPEAAIKYFIIGSIGSALVLYGISFVYAANGDLGFNAITAPASNTYFKLGMLFMVIGLALEFAAVPFHMWLPDVYEGSPTTITMLIATLPKIAIFAITYRLLTTVFANLSADWAQIFMILAMLSVIVGNLLAIAQSNIKRMLGYSTIGHIGFVLLGLFSAQTAGFIAVIFYVIVYAFMVLAALAVIMHLTAKGFEAEKLEEFVGLAQRDPWIAFIMLLVMLSLAGVPPLLGFYAKFLILQNLVAIGYPMLAALALLFSVIGSFYYLRVIKNMYFEQDNRAVAISGEGMAPLATKILYGHGLLLLLFGVFPGTILVISLKMLS